MGTAWRETRDEGRKRQMKGRQEVLWLPVAAMTLLQGEVQRFQSLSTSSSQDGQQDQGNETGEHPRSVCTEVHSGGGVLPAPGTLLVSQ